MRCLDLFFISGKNVLRAGTRTALCVLAICIGITSVSAVLGLGSAAGETVKTEMERIGIGGVAFYHKSGESLQEEAIAVVAQTPGVSAVMPLALVTGSVTLRNLRSSAGILGIDEALGDVFHLEVLHGTLPNAQQIRAGEKIAVVDEEFAQKVYQRTNIIGKKLTVTVNGISEKMEICAVIRSQSAGLSALLGGQLPYLVYVPHTTLGGMSAEATTDKLITAMEEERQEVLVESILTVLNRKFGNVYRSENLSQYLDSFTTITDAVSLLISGIAAISVIVGGIGVMNAMVSAVDARTREIGIYRALGAKKRDIVQTFMVEALFLCLAGGLGGIALNYVIFLMLNIVAGITIAFQWQSALLSLLIAACCGVVFGILPAIRAARLDPIQAIRME